MKVEIENGRIIKKFGELKCGEIFVDNNYAYVKMNNLLDNNNAFSFGNAIMSYFPYNTEVEMPKEIILKVKV